LNIIRPNWDAPSNIKVISTTRRSLGSPSSDETPDVYDYCNLGAHVGDDIESVNANRERLLTHYNVPSNPVWLEQTHSTDVLELGQRNLRDTGGALSADGSITRERGVVCAVMTADCLPLMLSNTQGTQVAAVHAGWRGMADGIIEAAVAKFDCEPSRIIAWAGPCIGPSKFEVGSEVKQQLGGLSSHYKPIDEGKVLANLYAICGFKLAELGVTNYSHSSSCTYTDQRLFYSYRRDGQCGRMASLIWIGDSE